MTDKNANSEIDIDIVLKELRLSEQLQSALRSQLKTIIKDIEIPFYPKTVAIRQLEAQICKARRSPGGLRDLNKKVNEYYHHK